MEPLKAKYYNTSGSSFFLEDDPKKLQSYLLKRGWLVQGDRIDKIEKPGEGNMNFVFRVIPAKAASFIVKQARPWVEKYPDLAAPVNRIHVEHQYYKELKKYPQFEPYSPAVLGFDRQNHILALEDLGPATDFTFVYRKDRQFNQKYLRAATDYLNYLRQVPVPDYPSNLGLRRLNHQHIFLLPFQENTFDLDQIQPGLQHLARQCKQDTALVNQVRRLGEYYLDRGNCLLHGDFYPGSMLNSVNDLKVIDPEFSFAGPEEWDVAVFTAHLFLAETNPTVIQASLKLYQYSDRFDHHKYAGFTGTEILRRLLGLAQVPVEMTLDQKNILVQQAMNWIKTGKIDM